jgi:hypothetical protein
MTDLRDWHHRLTRSEEIVQEALKNVQHVVKQGGVTYEDRVTAAQRLETATQPYTKVVKEKYSS